MKKKRIACFTMALFLAVSCPVVSYASTATAAWTAGRYAFSLLLNYCGVQVSASSLSAWIGEWSGYDDYMAKGGRGELGAFSQYLYDVQANAETEAAREKALKDIEQLQKIKSAVWGGVVSVLPDIVNALKSFLRSFSAYGTDSKDYVIVPEAITGDKFYTYSATKLFEDQGYVYTEGYDFVFSCKAPLSKDAMYNSCYPEYNVYAPPGVLSSMFGVLDSAGTLSFGQFSKDSASGHVGLYLEANRKMTYLDGTVNTGGRLKAVTFSSTDLSVNFLRSLPFPIFLSWDSVAEYIGGTDTSINKTAVGLPVESVRPAFQDAAAKAVPTAIQLPASADAAARNADAINNAQTDAAFKTVVVDSGLVIDWGAADVEIPTEAPTDDADGVGKTIVGKLSDVISAIESIPDAILSFFDDKLETEDPEQNIDSLSLPALISSKFPFCVPFDLAYLVGTLSSERKAPYIEFPVRFEYLSFDFEHTFVVDFSQFEVAATTLRVMLDLLFVAGLIMVTRDLIRG